jgi:tricorn protease-like protein
MELQPPAIPLMNPQSYATTKVKIYLSHSRIIYGAFADLSHLFSPSFCTFMKFYAFSIFNHLA